MTPALPAGLAVIRELGRGSHGQVLLARADGHPRPVAVKRIEFGEPLSSQTGAAALDEALALQRVKHPNVVRVLDYLTTPSAAWLVMEFVEGPTLQQILDHYPRVETPRALHWSAQLMSAVAAVSDAGVVHADIKSANVVVTNGNRIRLVDFGLCSVMDRQSVPTEGGMPRSGGRGQADPERTEQRPRGTPAFMAPELRVDARPSPASDVYAAVVTICWLLTGARPRSGVDPAFPEDVPAAVRRLLLRGLSTDARDRPVAGVLRDELVNAVVIVTPPIGEHAADSPVAPPNASLTSDGPSASTDVRPLPSISEMLRARARENFGAGISDLMTSAEHGPGDVGTNSTEGPAATGVDPLLATQVVD